MKKKDDNYILTARLTPKGEDNGITINAHYEPGNYNSCLNCLKEVVSKIDTIIDKNEKVSKMFDIPMPTEYAIHITLSKEDGPLIYATVFRDDVIYYIKTIMSKMNYLL